MTLSLPTEEVFQVNGQNRPLTNLPAVDFQSQAERNTNTKATEYVTFGFYFSILVFRQFVLRIVKALPFIHQPNRVTPKASDVSGADWLYQHMWKKYDIFSSVLLRLFSGPEIPL